MKKKILIVAANYYVDISDGLLSNVKKVLQVPFDLISVPGVFEIPVIISKNIDELNLEFMNNNISIVKKGVEYFDKKLENPKYFIWSNDFSGIKSLFPSNKIPYISHTSRSYQPAEW